MPKFDVQAVDLLDEHENRATDSGRFLTIGQPKPLAPTPKRLQFLFVQAHCAHPDRTVVLPNGPLGGAAALVKARRLGSGDAHLLDDRITLFSLDDPFVRGFGVLVSGHEHEAARMLTNTLILFHAEHYGLEATRIGALAQERHPIRGPEPMAVSGALEPF